MDHPATGKNALTYLISQSVADLPIGQDGAAALPKSGRKSPLPLGFLARIVSGAGEVRVFQPPPAGTLLKKTTIS